MCDATSWRFLAPAPPPGLTDPDRTAGVGVPEFRKVTSSIFYACARARGPASQQLRKPAPLQPTGDTPELLVQHTRLAATTPQARVAATNLTGPAAPPLLARARVGTN